MRIAELTKSLAPVAVTGPGDLEVSGLYYDSRQVRPGGLFFALPGTCADGCQFVPAALANGAVAVVAERPLSLPDHVAGIVVANARKAMAVAALRFYEDPLQGMTVVGVTGTNGKTTVCYQLEAIFRAAGRRPAVLGTVNYRFENTVHPAPHTTPESVDLLGLIAGFRRDGADTVIMEVSSHGLEQHRVEGFLFDVAAFTNLTPEHLDYHGDMKRYFAAKRRLFSDFVGAGGRRVINVDDPYGLRLALEMKGALTCGGTSEAAVRAGEIHSSFSGTEGVLITPQGPIHLCSRLFGSYNLSNLMVAAAAALAAGLPVAAVEEGIRNAPQVPGRLEMVDNDRGAVILVDYAHTAEGLQSVLRALKEMAPVRLVTAFGCGGDRDRSKRPRMGQVVGQLSDLVILTSDNPRSEDPLAILEQIKGGVRPTGRVERSPEEYRRNPGGGFTVLPERREAIAYAVSLLAPGDVLLVAGKGHEDYQIIGGRRLHFDDREEIRNALRNDMGDS
ncbi:MAG: UDP-N-acetylmuramoyl-L-alanyl-D-glutamate--2,6-diaminopimelate ligase [Desulfuromonadaceae bacterium]|nr:UDP-N-acetylmuramoyl-L-alanyl-D-glutamate--2,6-diaminopimelate ligase [Desulfuromonadaceae bacterium]